MTKSERIMKFFVARAREPTAMTGEEFLATLGDPPADLFDPAAEFEMIGDDFGGFTTAVPGPEAQRVWGDWIETYESYVLEAVDMEEGEDVVLFLLRASGRTRGAGMDVEHEAAGVFRFGGERVVRTELYLNWNQARAAAGLERG